MATAKKAKVVTKLSEQRDINAAGLKLVEDFEGLRLKAYPDPATGGKPWTIGYGHTGDVAPGLVITEATAQKLLEADLNKFENTVQSLCHAPLTDNQFGACVALAFNIGGANFAKSTLVKYINAGKYDKAADQFLVWNKAKGKVMAGLTRRRKAERALFLTV